MSNRRSYGSDRGGNYGGNNYSGNSGSGGRYNNNATVNPWQSGSIPARNAVGPAPLTQKLLNLQMNPPGDSSVAIATLLTSILQQNQQPPSLMSLNAGNFNFSRFGGNSNSSNDRGRRDDRRSDQYRGNRRQPNERNRDRKTSDKGRYERPKKNDDNAVNKEASRDRKPEPLIKPDVVVKKEEKPKEKVEHESEKEKDKDKDGDEAKEKNVPHGPIAGFENIPAKLFHCHICGKTMWNDVSFDTHIKGRNHRNKLRDLEDSYQVQTDLMRQIASISLRLDEIRRGKRRPYPDQYCKMCDLHFNGMTMFAHRSTDEHQNLKRFIHPTCNLCNVDFQVRLEYDEHILSAAHLQEEAKALLRREKYDKDPIYVALREQEAKLRLLLDEVADIGTGTSPPEVSEEDKKLLETLGEEGQVPAYNPEAEIIVARQHITPVEGFLCKICKIFVLAPETVDVHCKTQNHYESYIAQLKYTATKLQRDKENAEEKRKADEIEEKSPKRMKTEENEDEVNGDSLEETTDVKTEKMEEDAAPANPEPTPVVETKPTPKNTARRGRGRGRGRRY